MSDLLHEGYVSVDVETAGPHPSRYALLSIGACLVSDPGRNFYIELQPTSMEAQETALLISRLSMEELAQNGVPAEQAMARFEAWLTAEIPDGQQPVFVAFNAAFDWMFVNDYFHRFLGRNPFGHSALDIKAYYMGQQGVRWSETSMRHVAALNPQSRPLTHNALSDAQEQARLFEGLLQNR
jgi:DNA polymerase III epsilon subunit-like protein